MSFKSYFISTIILTLINVHCVNTQKSAIEIVGDIALFAMPIAAISTTFIKGDPQGTWQFTKGFLLSQALTYGLKASVTKPRPDVSDTNAFPSGHTSTTFQSASFIHRRYGFTYSIPAYAVAGFTAFSRINADKHDGWDVLAGALIGVGSTCLFTTAYQKEHMELTFNSSKDNYLVGSPGFTYKF